MQKPMEFAPVDRGIYITFRNSWTVFARQPRSEQDSIEVEIQMPNRKTVPVYGHQHFFVNSNDLAAVIAKVSSIAVSSSPRSAPDVNEKRAIAAFEGLIEDLALAGLTL
jgi:hypothetical protein